jgi:plastocyanin
MRRLRRLLIILPLVVAAASACGGNDGTANNVGGSNGTPPPAVSGHTISVKETEYTFAPSALTLKPGTYTITVTNVGEFPHDLHVAVEADGTEMGGSTVVPAGHSSSFTVTLKSGQYRMWCAVDAHKSLGMQGTITVH